MPFLQKSSLVLILSAMTSAPVFAAGATLVEKPASCFGVDLSFAGPLLSGTAQPAEMFEVPNDGIENYMPVGSAKQGLPETIQGIWWMDGNPGGLLVTLGNATYDAATRTATLPASAPGSYAFWPSPVAGCIQGALSSEKSGFIIQFSEDFQHATLVNFTEGDSGTPELDTNSHLTMDLAGDGHWVRHSAYFGIPILDYQLRRIVKGDGTRDEFEYNAYLKFAGATAMIGTRAGQ